MQRVEKKAVRLVADDRVVVTWRSPRGTQLQGMVRGDSGIVYTVAVDPAGEWCDCPWGGHHPGSRCSHTLALQLQAAREGHPLAATMQAKTAEGGDE